MDKGTVFDGFRIGSTASKALHGAGYTSVEDLPDDLEELRKLAGIGDKAIARLSAARTRASSADVAA